MKRDNRAAYPELAAELRDATHLLWSEVRERLRYLDRFESGAEYGEAYGPGDVVGCLLVMGDPPATVRMRQRINLKGVEYLVEEERDRVASHGSSITFYKNGVSQGAAFTDVWAEVYYPAASLFKAATVTFNFGPDFECKPAGLDARPVARRQRE